MVQNLFNSPRKVKMKLVGLDGNAFVIMGACQRNAKRQGWNDADIETVLEAAKSSNYNHLVSVIMEHSEGD
ncbi:hypothetical protein [Neisseria shayeganii]|uniref:Uncharacterized protein n=1 Tax=Neisseria shayeganii TaxID=607712 RepID=A0A7D7S905_9NEIS|nr:hypothetical protein [Neisseria shayeganii]QMT41288.1 hypothetical protein H3L94_04475 [Neisseria shayeganii]